MSHQHISLRSPPSLQLFNHSVHRNVGGDIHAINFDSEKLLELSGTDQIWVEENNVGKKGGSLDSHYIHLPWNFLP